MSDDPTRKMPGASFEARVLAELAAVRGDIAILGGDIAALDKRLITLEDKVDAWLRETRPIWEAIQVILEDIQSQLREVVRDLYSMRGRINRLEDRERPPAA